MTTKRTLREILDGDAIPDDVAHWIVEFHHEFAERDLTPLDAALRASRGILTGHCCKVTHVRSGLMWSVDLGRREVVEVKKVKS